MTDITKISPLPQPPQRADAPDVFAGRADAFVAALVPFVTETNKLGGDLNQKTDDAKSAASEAEQAKQEAETARDAALGAPSLVNYQGVWEAGTYNTGESVFHAPSESFYISDEDENTAEPPSGAWREVVTADPVPSGAVMNFAMPTAPDGWLEADGSEVSRTEFSALFNAIGTVWGEGDGSTTFNLPDARGEFMRGWDNGRGIDSGRAFGSSQADENKAHNHSGEIGSVGNHSHSVTAARENRQWRGDGFTIAGVNETFNSGGGGSHSHSLSIDNAGGNESRPRNIAILTCIKI